MWHTVLQSAIVVVLGVLVVALGGRVVTLVFRLAERKPKPQPGQEPLPGTEAPEPAPRISDAAKKLRGGAWIGMLERLAVYATILAGFPAGIAIALTVKGLARYPELAAPNSGAAERFIIGTFVSVLLAAGAAGLAVWLVGLV